MREGDVLEFLLDKQADPGATDSQDGCVRQVVLSIMQHTIS